MYSQLGLVAIVDDDAAMRKSIERLLRALGYRTAAFASAEEFLQSEIVDGVLGLVLDIHLGGMSGIDLCDLLNSAQPQLPVIFITARDDVATRAAATSVGCIDFLQKPFAASSLTRALERCRAFELKGNTGLT